MPVSAPPRKVTPDAVVRTLHDRRDLYEALVRPAAIETTRLIEASSSVGAIPMALRLHQWDKMIRRLATYDRRNDMRILGIAWGDADSALLAAALDEKFMADHRIDLHRDLDYDRVLPGLLLEAKTQASLHRLEENGLIIAGADSAHALFALHRRHPGGNELLAEFDDPEILARYALEVIDAEASRPSEGRAWSVTGGLFGRRFPWLRHASDQEADVPWVDRPAARPDANPVAALNRLAAEREGERMMAEHARESAGMGSTADRQIDPATTEDRNRAAFLARSMAIRPGATVLIAGSPSRAMIAAVLDYAPRQVVVVPETVGQAEALATEWRGVDSVIAPPIDMNDFLQRMGRIRYDSILLAIPGMAPDKAADAVSWAVMAVREGATIGAWLRPPDDPEDRLWPTLRAGLDRIGFTCRPMREPGGVAGEDYLLVMRMVRPEDRPDIDPDMPPGPEPA